MEELRRDIENIHDPEEEIQKIEDQHNAVLAQRLYDPLAASVRLMGDLKLRMRYLENRMLLGPNTPTERFLNEIGKRKGFDDPVEHNDGELISLLRGGSLGSIPDRRMYVFGKYNEWREITGASALSTIRAMEGVHEPSYPTAQREIRGQGVNRGVYRGRVKLIPFEIASDYLERLQELKKGDVLVSTTTGPEMVFAFRQVGAIVTDEGGVCSHAAIVSREFGIPAVIGTKVATERLHDGDWVEVDAAAGVVRILEHGGQKLE